MSRRTRHRPRRTLPGTEGGLGGLPGPDKAEAPTSFLEGGTAEPVGRQLGLDSRDIPGGRALIVNPESPASRPAAKEPRPLFEGMNAHGVIDPSSQPGYTDPPSDVRAGPPSLAVPKIADAVPVYVVQEPGHRRVIRSAATFHIRVAASNATEATRICGIDSNRVKVRVLNEDTVNDMRIGALDDVQGGTDGALISHYCNSYTDFETQDELWAMGTSTNSVLCSVILVTEVNE